MAIIYNGEISDTTNFVTNKYIHINSCGFQNTQADYTVVRKNGRQDYHILLLNNGGCQATHNGKEYTLSPGNIMLYFPNEPQQYIYTQSSTALWIHFSGKICSELFNDCGISSGFHKISPKREILDYFTETIRRFNMPGRERFANASLIELIYSVAEAQKNVFAPKTDFGIYAALTYINANYNKQITLEQLSKISGYSKSGFSHLFSSLTKTTPIKYCNGIRLKASLEMLVSTDLSITEIALDCGFSDSLYYSKLFKKEYGISPKEYRIKEKK